MRSQPNRLCGAEGPGHRSQTARQIVNVVRHVSDLVGCFDGVVAEVVRVYAIVVAGDVGYVAWVVLRPSMSSRHRAEGYIRPLSAQACCESYRKYSRRR
jgi:hypothetical protein